MEHDRTLVVPSGSNVRKDADKTAPAGIAAAPTPSSLPGIRAATTRVVPPAPEASLDEIDRLVAVERRYQLLGQFAEGGQGVVNTAKDLVLERYVAVKSLKPEHLANAAVVASFVAEAKITAQLDHPAIVPLYDLSGGAGRQLHMAMKLIFGRTLRELIDDAVLDCRQRRGGHADAELHAMKGRIEHFVAVCDAIAFAHAKGVVHRDLKQENVMVGQFHEVYVMDWGIAMAIAGDDERGEPPAEAISGTPGYIAPEIIAGRSPSPASDQYALGMMLFELVALKPGISAGGMAEVFNRTVRGEYEQLIHRAPHCRIPADLQAIIRKALASDPAARYADVAALAEDVRRFLRDEETAARPDNVPRRALRWLVRHRVLAAALALGTVALFGGLAATSTIRHQRAVIQHRQRQLRHVALQGRVASRAHRIDRHLLRTADVLGLFMVRLRFLLAGKGQVEAGRIFPHHEFHDHQQAPPGTMFSPFYQQPVSFAVASYKLAPVGATAEEVAERLGRLGPAFDDLVLAMAAGDPGAKPRPFATLVQQAMTAGLPVASLYVGFEDGLMVAYPGSSYLVEDYDPRTRPWYLQAEDATGVVWSMPYGDAAGLGVIVSASQALHDHQGDFLGVVSLDMTFDAINKLLGAAADDLPVIERYLIDRQGDVMLQSRLRSGQEEAAQQDFSTLSFAPFPYPEIVRQLRRDDSGQFEVAAADGSRLIAYAPVPTMGWFLVEEIALSEFHRAGVGERGVKGAE